jgi:3-isopropylmalate/(R)-2-methylmalate dehydratase large subunit
MTNLISLDQNKRILFLTKDLKLIKEQLYNGLNLLMKDLSPKDLLDDINTDIMTPAWVCFHYDPKEIAKRAYAGLLLDNERIFVDNALIKGNFQAIVSGKNKGCGSSRETAAQCEAFCGIKLIFAESFAPIHQRNNINLGQLMGSYDLLIRLQNKESINIDEFLAQLDKISQDIIRSSGLFAYLNKLQKHSLTQENIKFFNKPLNMAQKIMAKKFITHQIAKVDKGYSHEFTSAQVHKFLEDEFGKDYIIKNPESFAAFEDHLIYTDQVARFSPFSNLIQELRNKQKEFIKHNKIKDYSAKNHISPGICHEVAKEEFIMPSDFIQATDSHTCMGGALNAFAYGVGATEYASILATGLSIVHLPGSINFNLVGKLKNNCSAKDIILYILANYTKKNLTLNKIMEFTGKGLTFLSIDERATLCNMATECGAKTAICEPDEELMSWLLSRRNKSEEEIRKSLVWPDKNHLYEAGSFEINLDNLEPMIALPSDPTNVEYIKNINEIPINIAYGGSCTAGKIDDIAMYAKVIKYYLDKGITLPNHINFYIQYGSYQVKDQAITLGFDNLFKQAGVKIINPGCGACIGCGPGVSENKNQVTISAINRNFEGRSGPGRLYLASPLTVAASAFMGKITMWNF